MQQAQPAEGKSIPMISSFLNLCRVCPVPTDDKVNSEYKRNFTWHDGYQTTKVDVIKNAPSLPQSTVEPSLPRKKKYPEFGHRTRDLLFDHEEGDSSDSLEIGGSQLGLSYHQSDTDSKQRITDEDSKQSSKHPDDADSRKLEEKQPLMSQSFPPAAQPRGNPGTPGLPDGEAVQKTTEYRSQFVAYPRAPGEAASSTARKSASMGLINAAKRGDSTEADGQPLETCISRQEDDDEEAALDAVKRGRIKKTEYKAKFRPFSAYTYVDGSWKKATRLIKDRAADDMDLCSSFTYPLFDGDFIDSEPPADTDRNAWYSEVVERLKKADQYRVRSHAGGSYGQDQLPPELMFGHVRDKTILSPVSVASSSRTWKDDRPTKERGRTAIVPVHHRKERKEYPESPDHFKSREGSTKKKHQVEKTTVRPKSAEPMVPVKSENKSPKRTRPKAPRDLPVHGHGDLSGRKKAFKQAAEKSSPLGGRPRAVPRAGGEDGKVWLKPDSDRRSGRKVPDGGGGDDQSTMVNGYSSDSEPKMMNGEAEDSVHDERHGHRMNGEHIPITKPPMKVPLTTVKSPEEVTGVRSPDPESWTVPLEIGKGLQWMDGKTPDGVQPKGPPILLSKRLKESSLVGKTQKDIVVCDPGIENTGESVDL